MAEKIFAALTAEINFKSLETNPVSAELCEHNARLPKKKLQTRNEDSVQASNIIRKELHIRVTGDSVSKPVQSFREVRTRFQDSKELFKRVKALKYKVPTAVQCQVIPLLLASRDVIAIAPTGSGKTLAFLLPILLETCKSQATVAKPSAVLLSPSRELAQQTARNLAWLSEGLEIHSVNLTKATAAGEDFGKVDVVLSTPLRLQRLVKRGRANLGGVRFLILDEADRLLEPTPELPNNTFLKQIDRIVAACSAGNNSPVIGIFSATIPERVEELAKSILQDPVRVTVGARDSAATSVQQQLKFVGSEEGKILVLQQMLQAGIKPPILVFVSSSDKATLLHRRLLGQNLKVDSIYGSQDYSSRQNALESFRSGETWVLISTDLLARGIDFVAVETVINYDCPKSTQEYVHRVGRTGRAGHHGFAVTFFTENDAPVVRKIANLIVEAGQKVPEWMLDKRRMTTKWHESTQKKKRKTDQ